MNSRFSGGCVCGAVRYQVDAPLDKVQMFKCHCRDCQHVGGGGFSAVVMVPRATVTFTKGSPKYHHTQSEAIGLHRRSYCAECGSRLTGGEGEGMTNVGFLIGSLDDPSWFKPQIEFWVQDAQPWDLMDPTTPKFDKYPPR